MVLVKMFDFYFMIVMLIGLGFTTGLLNGHKFYVGGRDGWVLTPSEDYSHWSHRNRFQVNDSLYFKYVKGKDSVLEVSTEEEYNTCNTTHPMTSLSDGDSLFLLSRSGPFFFVSGNSGSCLKGQKLAVTVMSTVHHTPRHPPSPSPSPSASPVHQGQALSSPAPSPDVDPADSKVLAPAPGPAARNLAVSVGPWVVSLGLVFALQENMDYSNEYF